MNCISILLMLLCPSYFGSPTQEEIDFYRRPIQQRLPDHELLPGWLLQGEKHIRSSNDASETERSLWQIYGLKESVQAVYTQTGEKDNKIDVTVFKMGSTLDAFGVYSTHIAEMTDSLPIDDCSSIHKKQLFLYRGRYFVDMIMSGLVEDVSAALSQAAERISPLLTLGGCYVPDEVRVLHNDEVFGASQQISICSFPRTIRYVKEPFAELPFIKEYLIGDFEIEGETCRAIIALEFAGQHPLLANALKDALPNLQWSTRYSHSWRDSCSVAYHPELTSIAVCGEVCLIGLRTPEVAVDFLAKLAIIYALSQLG